MSFLGQFVNLFPFDRFNVAAQERGTDKWSKGLTSWNHFICNVCSPSWPEPPRCGT
ncbi:MAG: DUF4372 domain-containing protein [Deltaproteobacteria bacterium]|nr:DUF4372 domain-containing protein [Deltaproteobacteria bacterium]